MSQDNFTDISHTFTSMAERFSRERLEEELNPPQLEAVDHGNGPLLILAGAGSGKTRAITYRIARLIAGGLSPYRLIALTFTNKAAAEMKERAQSLLGGKRMDIWISTFHSACLRLLRRDAERIGYPADFVVYDAQDQERLMRLCLADIGLDEKKFPARQMGAMISGFKNRLKGAKEAEAELNPRRFEEFLKIFYMYEKRLADSRSMDFDDLLGKAVYLLKSQPDVRERYVSRFSHILVDEFQDTNVAQYELIRLLIGPERNICVVGDDDQSIYQWRGANIANILNFEKDFPEAKVVKLEQNYRSTRTILECANAVVSRNPNRKKKSLWTNNSAGEKVTVYMAADEVDEGWFVARSVRRLMAEKGHGLSDFAVFYRTNSQSRAIEDALRREGLAYQVYGGLKFYERKEVKDILAYFRAALNPYDEVSFNRVVNTPPRGIGATTLERLEAYAREAGMPLALALDEIDHMPEMGRGAKPRLAGFRETLARIRSLAATKTAPDAFAEALQVSGYMDWLAKEETSEAASRMENLNELVNAAEDFAERTEDGSITAFLDQAALVADADTADQSGAVRLMTVHISKGLEFPVVFITGLEEDIFPHARSKDDPSQMEEERRLMYVAMTRARQKLFITYADTRRVFGVSQMNRPSRFVADLPQEMTAGERPSFAFGASRRPAFDGGYRPSAAPERRFPVESVRPSRESWPKPPAQGGLDFESRPTPPAASTVPPGEFAPGMKVRHKSFQVGFVRNVEGKGENSKITVYFPRFGEKKLVLKYANLEAV